MTYLLFDVFNGISKSSIEALLSPSKDSKLDGAKPLFDYTCRYWYQHVLHATECDDIYEILMILFEKRYQLLKSLEDVLWLEYPILTDDEIEGHARLLRFAVAIGSPWIVKRVIHHSPNLINSEFGYWETPLILAAEKGHLDIVELLLECGANVNKAIYEDTPLTASIKRNYEDVFELLLKRGADVDGYILIDRWTALHWAAYFGRTNLTSILLRHNANLNTCDHWGKTPLHIAVSERNLETMQLLVDAGSDPTLKDDDGKTPLHLALDCNLPEDPDLPLDSSQRIQLAKQSVEILLSRHARLSDIGPVSRKMVEWASSEPWYSDMILTDDDN